MAAKKDGFIFLKIKIMFNPLFHGAVSVIKLATNFFLYNGNQNNQWVDETGLEKSQIAHSLTKKVK